MPFVMRTSIHGRRLGITSTGGIGTLSTADSTSHSPDQVAQMWGDGMVETLDSTTTPQSLRNYGISILSSDTEGAVTFNVPAPIAGLSKEIHFQTPSTLIYTFDTTATTIFFNSTLAEGAALGSTTLTAVSPGTAGMGGSLILRGLSATVWQIVGNSVGASS